MKETANRFCPYCNKDYMKEDFKDNVIGSESIIECVQYSKGKIECPLCKKVFILTRNIGHNVLE